jgi:hypothetical protein|tara:strand:+ start:148 stop:519 length:372 start_codon:yes stop_codon:yes gene_type:complete
MKKLTCKNCKHSETLEKINGSAITKILIAEIPRQRKKDGLNIYPLYCLKCNFITEWATDPQNSSSNSIDGIEYFKTFKINKEYNQYFQGMENSLLSRGYTNTEKTKYTIGWILLIIFVIALFK